MGIQGSKICNATDKFKQLLDPEIEILLSKTRTPKILGIHLFQPYSMLLMRWLLNRI